MAVQDDRREQELIELFELLKLADAGRAGLDAMLPLDGVEVPFELKSTTRGSVTTVRDFGRDHIEKWTAGTGSSACTSATGSRSATASMAARR